MPTRKHIEQKTSKDVANLRFFIFYLYPFACVKCYY